MNAFKIQKLQNYLIYFLYQFNIWQIGLDSCLLSSFLKSTFPRNSSFCAQRSGKSSLDNNYSIEEEVGSEKSGQSKEDMLDSDDNDERDLVVRAGFNGLSIEYRPPKQHFR